MMTLAEGRSKLRQGRLAEGEIDIRRALLNRLKYVGKYHADVAQMLFVLAEVMDEQGRHGDSEDLARRSFEIYRSIGYRADGQFYVAALNRVATNLYLQGRFREAKEAFADFNQASEGWTPARIEKTRSSWAWIFLHYYTQEVDRGIELARATLAYEKAVKGERHFDTAMARAVLASGLSVAGRDVEAAQEFKSSIPILLTSSRESEDEDAAFTVASDLRLRQVVEANIELLARSPDKQAAAAESLRLADAIRARSVQNALAASSARTAARTPALADLARKSQDLTKQVSALTSLVGDVLSQPADQRDEKAIKQLQADLEKARNERSAAKREIDRRFPEYANLVRPLPVTAEEIRTALRPEEALLSFYFGTRSSFAWAVRKDGPIAFAALPTTAGDMEKKVNSLRVPFESDAATISAIPAFDVAAAHDLYKLLLQPVIEVWHPAKSLIVVTNGALGLLPLSLLPTAPADVQEIAGEPYFAAYRKVDWLARTHAVVSVPSASALRTLRSATAAVAKRESFIGFADPIFSLDQMREPVPTETAGIDAADVRGVRFRVRASPHLGQARSATLGMLPRLPDTAEELKSVATALQVDPSKVLHLGKAANEKTVKSLDLSRYRIVAFSTHGLVPGDLDGLTEPALALTAPEVADVEGDGLLTMEEILALRLNADWVVLSACNTAAGSGAGAEAASGLGRAFFYAGSKALLVTNWSVHSVSARELVIGIFKRQAADQTMSRSQALRQAMMMLLDEGAAKDPSGKPIYSYAHPLFWAPYSIIGDGGSE
jgi:CHAT domain-containing protein